MVSASTLSTLVTLVVAVTTIFYTVARRITHPVIAILPPLLAVALGWVAWHNYAKLALSIHDKNSSAIAANIDQFGIAAIATLLLAVILNSVLALSRRKFITTNEENPGRSDSLLGRILSAFALAAAAGACLRNQSLANRR